MKNTMNEMFAMMLLLMVVAMVLQVIIGTLTLPLDQLLQEVHMDELYNLCKKKCKYIRVNYSKMLDEDKQLSISSKNIEICQIVPTTGMR